MLARYNALHARMGEIGDEVDAIETELDDLHARLNAAGVRVRRHPEEQWKDR
jgi:hypothetical protein